MDRDTGVETEAAVPCLERLQREAFVCLNGFPNKVMELNTVVDSYTPHSIGKSRAATAHPEPSSRSVASTEYYDPDHDAASYTSMSTLERTRTRTGICKRRYYRLKCFSGHTLRRRPGPLGQILAAFANSLAIFTKAIVIRPSRYIIDNVVSMFSQSDFIRRRELIHVHCRPSAVWDSSMSRYTSSSFFVKDTTVDHFIGTMRPSAAQLIADTTVLKRWLQALALTSVPPTSALTHAARTTETIDCWAYELFFHLKYLQENRTRHAEKAAALGFKVSDDVTHTNLWHRMVQLRDNYVILYETLYSNNQFLGQSWESTEVIGENYSSLFSA